MKLEEVLPAMRAGRNAFDRDGDRWRLSLTRPGLLEMDDGDEWLPGWQIALDGWTLEPEPKVEWPKGSIQDAMSKAGPDGLVRRKGWPYPASIKKYQGKLFGQDFDIHALDWEVMP